MLKKILEVKKLSGWENKTIKEILKEKYSFSKRIINNIKNNNGILKNGKYAKINDIYLFGDIIEIYIEESVSENIIPVKMDLDIIYEDEYLIAVNKPHNLVVHPTSYHYDDTLANGIMYYFDLKGIQCKFRAVNRLDRDTSGLVLIAKSQLVHSILSNRIINKNFKKEYIAIVHNKFDELEGIIDKPIARKLGSIMERMVDEGGQNAITEYSVISQNENAALVKINLITGRTHQIRVHFSHINHTLYGDDLYGANDNFQRQALHCFKLKFVHPILNIDIELEVPLQQDLKELLKSLKLDNNS